MRQRFTLRQIEYFVAVCEAGSVAGAAEAVHVSSPSVSAAISQIEAEFGLPLFVRKHAHGLAPTQAGRQFLDQAQRLLAEADQLNRLASDLSGAVRGPLNLGCLLTFAQLVVPRLRRTFAERFPQVRIRQEELDQQAIFEGLRDGRLDLALTYDLDIPDDLRFAALLRLPPLVVLAETHPLAENPAIRLADLRGLPMVLLDLPLSSAYFLSFFRSAGFRPEIAERTRDVAVMRSLVGNGFGYSFVNMRPLHDRSPDGCQLRYLPVEDAVRPLTMGLAMANGAENVLTVRTFADHCRSAFARGAPAGSGLA